jgi:hypothetical protein
VLPYAVFHHAQLDAALVMSEEDLGTEPRDRVAITARPALLEPDALTERQVERSARSSRARLGAG